MQPALVNATCSHIYLVDLLEWIVNLLLVKNERGCSQETSRTHVARLVLLLVLWLHLCQWVGALGANVQFWLKAPRVVIFLPPTTLKMRVLLSLR